MLELCRRPFIIGVFPIERTTRSKRDVIFAFEVELGMSKRKVGFWMPDVPFYLVLLVRITRADGGLE